MEINFLSILAAAVSTLFVGMVWYHPKVFGNLWMKESRTYPDGKGPKMPVILVSSLLYAILIATVLQTMVIHQIGAYQATVDIKNVDASVWENYFSAYGNTYRTFKHGALHGFMAGLFFALPVVGTNALYERRSFKYTLVTGGFWVVACMLMGGIMCMWV